MRAHGESLAEQQGLLCELYPAEWLKYGASAGPRRNTIMAQRIVSDALIVIRFPDSRGSRNMLEIMRSRGCEHILDIVLPRPPSLP